MAPLVVTAPGLYTMSAEDYHRDPVGPEPSLSSSVARILIADSPAHARLAHPRLNPDFQRLHAEKFDKGSAAHACLLEGENGSGFAVVDAKDWRTKAAQEARADAYLAGKTPLLAEQWDEVQAMVEAANDQLDNFDEKPRPFVGGIAEAVLVWREVDPEGEGPDVWCRARLDYLHDNRRMIDDYKSTGQSANPYEWTRGPLFREHYDVQDAFYRRGVKAVFGVDAAFRFVVQENHGDYQLSVIALDPAAVALSERKCEWAIRRWRRCLATGEWRGYPRRTCYAEPLPWHEEQWMAREALDWTPPRKESFDDGRSLVEQLWGADI